MQAAKPVAEPDRDAMLKDIAAELGQHEVVGPGLLHRIISDAQRRYDVADPQRRTRRDARVVGHGGQGRQATNSAASLRAHGGHDWSPR